MAARSRRTDAVAVGKGAVTVRDKQRVDGAPPFVRQAPCCATEGRRAMEDARFDRLARLLGRGVDRRAALAGPFPFPR